MGATMERGRARRERRRSGSQRRCCATARIRRYGGDRKTWCTLPAERAAVEIAGVLPRAPRRSAEVPLALGVVEDATSSPFRLNARARPPATMRTTTSSRGWKPGVTFRAAQQKWMGSPRACAAEHPHLYPPTGGLTKIPAPPIQDQWRRPAAAAVDRSAAVAACCP
jgi:hypothetical protein